MTIRGVAPGGLAVVGDSSAGDTVWASDPSRNDVVRIDEHLGSVVRRIHTPTRAVDGIIVAHGDVWVAVPAPQ